MSTFGIVYKVTNKVNGKVYIGQTTRTLNKRKSEHISAALTEKYKGQCSEYFHNALRKYGKNAFVWEILETCSNKYDLDLAEQWYVMYYNTFKSKTESNGYNLTKGGNGNSGLIFSDEHKRKISESKKGNKLSEAHKQKIRDNAKINPNYGNKGRVTSNYTKNLLREANLGKKLSDDIKRKIGLSSKGNKHALGYKHTDEVKAKMSKSTSGKNNPMYGVPSPLTGVKGKDNHLAKKYVVILPDGKEFLIIGMKNFCDNYKQIKLYHSSLIKVAKGKLKTHKGFKCRYYDEDRDSHIKEWDIN